MTSAKNVLFIGNPGVGKSTLLNSLLGEAHFKSGVKTGSGMTTALQVHAQDGVTYMDTPGLDDVDTRERAAQEIAAALRRGGDFRICFVVTTEAGRNRPSDFTTMRLVTEAVSVPFPYAIVINKASKKVMELQIELYEEAVRLAENATGRRPEKVMVLGMDMGIYDENDKTANSAITEKLRELLDKLGSAAISDQHVAQINTATIEQVTEEMKARHEALKAEFAAEKKAYEEAFETKLAALDAKAAELERRAQQAQIIHVPVPMGAGDGGGGRGGGGGVRRGGSGLCGKPTATTGAPCRNTSNCPHH